MVRPRRIGRRIDPAAISSSAGIRRHEARHTAGAPAEVRGEHVGVVPIGSLHSGWALKIGPVLVAIRWSDEAEAIRMANDSHYGLAAYV